MFKGIPKQIITVVAFATMWALPGQANDAEEAEKAELAKQQAFRAGMEAIVGDLNQSWYDSFIGSIDRNQMVDRIFGLRLIDQHVKKSFRERLDYTWDDLLVGQLRETDEGVKATLLGVESRGDRGRAIVRFDLPKYQFMYHEYDLLLAGDGRMRIVDWTDYLGGMLFSREMGEWLVAGMASKPAMRKLLDFRNVSDTELFRFGELLKSARDNKLARYLEILESLPEQFQRQRIVVETTVNLAKRVRKRRAMLAGLETMVKYYPNEPRYSLMLLDHYVQHKKYEEASVALRRVYDKFGFDDAAMEARLSAFAFVMGDAQDAGAYADRALELESDLELAWLSALNARAALEDYAGAVEALEVLKSQFATKLAPDTLGRSPAYRGLLKSAEFKAWHSPETDPERAW